MYDAPLILTYLPCQDYVLPHSSPQTHTSSVTMNCTKSIACSLIWCSLDYANATLLSVRVKNFKRLQRMQNTLIEWLLANAIDWAYPTRWRSFTGYWSSNASVTYKLLEFNEPVYLRSRITFNVLRRFLRSSVDDRLLAEYPLRTNIGAWTFRCAAPTIWNAMPYDIRGTACVSVFNSRLKAHYFWLSLNIRLRL